MFYVIVAFEHALLALKLVIGWILPDVPKHVKEDMQYKAMLKDKVLTIKPREHKGLRKQRQKQLFNMFSDRMSKKARDESKSQISHEKFTNIKKKHNPNETLKENQKASDTT